MKCKRFFYITPILSLLLLANTSGLFAQQSDSCNYALSFHNKILPVNGTFNDMVNLLDSQCLLNNKTKEFLDQLSSSSSSVEKLMGDAGYCKYMMIEFLNRCICDTSAKLCIYPIEKMPTKPTITESFDKKAFDASVLEIRDSALAALKRAYPGYKIYIDVNGFHRSLEEQKVLLKKGLTTTLFSAHMLGAAADFTIYFNNKMVNPTQARRSIYYSYEPYRILGKFVLDKGYFWGIGWDPGHIQLLRKTSDIITKYPDLLENGSLILFYSEIIKQDTIPAKYRETVTLLDNKFHVKQSRCYNEKMAWTEDTLLKPLTVDKNFKSAYLRRR